MGPSINDVRGGGRGPQKPMKRDENRYIGLGKANVVYELPKTLSKAMK